VDIATGRGFLTGVPRDPQRTFYYNAEDDAGAIRSRVAAICAHYGIEQPELAGLAVVSGVMFPDLYLVSGEGGQTNEDVFRHIESEIERGGFDHIVFDPLQDMSRSPETNDVFRALGRRLREMATKMRVSVGIVHHTRKLAPGQDMTMDDQRAPARVCVPKLSPSDVVTLHCLRCVVHCGRGALLPAGTSTHRIE
jgi:RecA-family ATPase